MTEEDKKEMRRYFDKLHSDILAEVDALIRKQIEFANIHDLDLPLTINLVADILHVKVQTVYKWKERKMLTFIKKNGRYFITRRELYIQLSGSRTAKKLKLPETMKSSSSPS